MEFKCPKGVFLLAIFVLIASLGSIKYVLDDDGKVIFFGFLLQGSIFQLYYLVIIFLGIITAIGLFLLKRWAFFIFLAQNVFYVSMFIINSLFTTKDMLLKVGWRNFENLLYSYRVIMIIAVFICIVFTVWILFYQKYFLIKKGERIRR